MSSTSAAAPLSVSVATPAANSNSTVLPSPLPSPSFSLAPQRSHSLRMTTPTSTNTPSAIPEFASSSSYSKPSYTARERTDRTTDRDRGGDRNHDRDRGNDRSTNERSERSDRYGGGDRDRGERSNDRSDRDRTDRRDFRSGGPRTNHTTSSSDFPSKSGPRRDDRDHRSGGNDRDREAAKRATATQNFVNSLPVVGLLATPESPTLPPAFDLPSTSTAENPFSILDAEEEQIVGVDEELPEFPLSHEWTVYFDRKQTTAKKGAIVPPKPSNSADPASSYTDNLTTVTTFSTVNEFLHLTNHLTKPSELDQNSTLHIFKAGITPLWEDPANKDGGKFIYRISAKDKYLLDYIWQSLILAVIGGTLDDSPQQDEICGIVLSRRRMGDRIAVWNKRKDNTESMVALGHRIRAAILDGLPLEHNPTIVLNYEDNEDTLKFGYLAGSNVRFTIQ